MSETVLRLLWTHFCAVALGFSLAGLLVAFLGPRK
jgi:hypothetical protein